MVKVLLESLGHNIKPHCMSCTAFRYIMRSILFKPWYSSDFFHRRANDVLRIETMMFEKYLKRVDPKDIMLQAAATSNVFRITDHIVNKYLRSANFVFD